MAKKQEETKSIWQECWDNYVAFVKGAWKDAWVSLRDALVSFVVAIFNWLELIVGAVFGGIWELLILPLGKYIKQLVIDFINKI